MNRQQLWQVMVVSSLWALVLVGAGFAMPAVTAVVFGDQHDWCGGHDVPESMCTLCNPELIPKFKESGDWCAGHGLPESVCPPCNPKPIDLAAMKAAGDWCGGHDVPESMCTLCNPELIPKFKEAGDWCSGHGLPESVCPPCNPKPIDLAAMKAAGDWCGGHDVPESMCTLCNPELIPKFKEAGDWCAGHGLPESVCPPCNPKPIDLAAMKAAGDWCGGHDVPESMCTLCNPELIPKFKEAGDWCAGHGLPESICPPCNPESSESSVPVADWCAGHSVPESKCTLCNPELIPQFKESGDWCAEHSLPESVCPICNPNALPPEAIEGRVVRFVTPELEARAGIQTEKVQRGVAAEAIVCSAQFAFHADRTADLRAVIPGVVREIHAETGATVAKGKPLFVLESVRVGDTQAHLRKAKEHARVAETNLKRLQRLNQRGMATARDLELAEHDLEDAQADMASAETELRMVGASLTDNPGRFTLTAPIAGTLIRRPAVIGTLATEETTLGMIADTSVMWALCDVPEIESGRLVLDAPINLTLGNGEVHEGRITWISAEIDPRSRTVKVRAEVPNPNGRLRANQFAQARIETDVAPNALLVSRDAVQRVGDLHVLFVRVEPGIYEPRLITVHAAGAKVRVEGRLKPGDDVVTTGAVLLRTEIMPGSIGAGCCEVEPLGGN